MNRRWPVVSFDAGGTLIEPWPSVGHVYASSAAAVGFGGVDPDSLNRQFAAAWRQAQSDGFDYTRREWASVVAQSFHGLVPEPASQALFSDAYERFAQPAAWRVFDDVRSTMTALRKVGVRLVVTSNWDERLAPLLERLDLAAEFECILVSAEIGFHKPDPRFFQAATTRMGVPAEQILHIGDGEREDVLAARLAGWSALRLCRHAGNALARGELGSLGDALPRILQGHD